MSQGTSLRVKSLAYLDQDPELLGDFVDRLGPEVYTIVLASAFKPLNRYNIRPGRIFGKQNDPKVRYRISELAGNVVVVKNMETGKNQYSDLETLLDWWNDERLVEITHIDEVLSVIKKYLTPFLGSFVVGALITWLLGKLK